MSGPTPEHSFPLTVRAPINGRASSRSGALLVIQWAPFIPLLHVVLVNVSLPDLEAVSPSRSTASTIWVITACAIVLAVQCASRISFLRARVMAGDDGGRRRAAGDDSVTAESGISRGFTRRRLRGHPLCTSERLPAAHARARSSHTTSARGCSRRVLQHERAVRDVRDVRDVMAGCGMAP